MAWANWCRIPPPLAPPGLRTSVTGPAGVIVDTYTLFTRVERPLLLVTATVVAVILLLVYRGPFLWLVPLVAVGAADQTATALTYLLARYGRRGLAMPDMRSIDAQAVAQPTREN